jgi:ABC-2 type transport system permease protein
MTTPNTQRIAHSWMRIQALAEKEALHIARDPLTLTLAFVLPLVMLVLFGYGVSLDIDHIPLSVTDLDGSPESRELRARFTAAEEFVDAGDAPLGGAQALFETGKAAAVLTIPQGYARDLSRGEAVVLGFELDAADAQSAQQALTRADALVRGLSARGLDPMVVAISGKNGLRPPIEARAWTRFNPAGKSALFLVPGLTAYVLAIVAVLLTSLTVAREWERGSMEQLFATPVGRMEIVIGKLLPYLGMGLLCVGLVLAAGGWVFGVPFRGNLLVLALGSLLFLGAMLGQGLLISVVTRNQMVATQVSTLSSMLPSMLLSGFMFPIENMPTLLQMLSKIVPAQYFIRLLRGVLLKGNGFGELWAELLALSGFAALMLVASTLRFQRRVV